MRAWVFELVLCVFLMVCVCNQADKSDRVGQSDARASIAALRRPPQSSVVFAWSRARRSGRGASVVRARESVRGRGERFSRPHRRVVRARATSRARGEVARRGRAKANLARAAQPNRARTRDLGGGVRDERAVRRRERGGDARGKTVASIARANVIEASVEASVEAFE